jgi:DNA-binding NarL/FixJ family response regulator
MTREKARILISDEHRMFAEGLRAMLMIKRHLGIPKIAESTKDALNLIENEPFDLLITGMRVPEKDDVEFIQKVKYQYPNIKILILTRQEDQNDLETFQRVEAEGFIMKDATPDEFLLAIESILYSNLHSSDF